MYSLAGIPFFQSTIDFRKDERKRGVSLFRLAVTLWVLCSLSGSLWAAEINSDLKRHERIAHFLFPQTSSWLQFSQFPRFPQHKMDVSQAEKLWHVIQPENDPALISSPGCEAALRLFMNRQSLRNFRVVRPQDQSASMLFYSGAANCREGDVTLIWRDFQNYAAVSVRVFDGQVLLVEPRKSVNFVTGMFGCCGDETDVYELDDLEQGTSSRIAVSKTLFLPDRIKPMFRPVHFDQPIVLRSSPVIDDRYDQIRSQYDGTPIYGNVLRRYGAGVQATQLGELKSARDRGWRLVVVPAGNDSLKTDTPYNVNVGWISP